MSASDDGDLDGILDSALDNFQLDGVDSVVAPSGAKGVLPNAAAGGSNENLNANGSASNANANNRDTEEAALRAFREALSAPLPSSGEAAEEELDMQLVEQFMKSLESLHSSVRADNTGANTDNTGAPANGENFIKALIDDFLSKDVLIEPIKQVKEGIGAYLRENGDSCSDGERYRRQYGIASELVVELESAARPQRIIELLASLKECGKFPEGIIDGLPDPSNLEDSLAGSADNVNLDNIDDGEIGADIAAMTEACKLQ